MTAARNGANNGQEFEAVLEYLKQSRGFDFTGYKRSSLQRRASKRLQSSNEELQTMNDELRQRTDDLNQTNAFLESVLASLHVGAIAM
jgi:chemotaxis methyl-accepting protein methylase